MGENSRDARFWAIVAIAVATLFRLWYAATTGLAWDECYYWQWSRQPDLAYYDQGPGIAWLIRLGTSMFGDTTLGIRFGTILVSGATLWFGVDIARRILGNPSALWTLALLLTAPLLAAGGVLATYDGPQVFFWTLGVWTLLLTARSEWRWGFLVLGAVVGLGILCKITMLAFTPGVLIALLIVPHWRRWLATPFPYAGLAIALLGLIPLILWNRAHDFIGFGHMRSLSGRGTDAAIGKWLGDFLAGQMLVVGPFVWIIELIALFQIARGKLRGVSLEARAIIVAFSLPLLLYLILNSLRAKAEINWAAPLHVTGLMAAAASLASVDLSGSAWGFWRNRLAVGVSALLGLFAFFPSLPALARLSLPPGPFVKLNETFGWETIGRAVDSERKKLSSGGRDAFVAGTNYRVNSALAFYVTGKPQPVALFFGSRRDQYFVWTDPKKHIGRDAVLCFDSPGGNKAAVDLAKKYFQSVERRPLVLVNRPGYNGPVKVWEIFVCKNFKGYDPGAHVDGY